MALSSTAAGWPGIGPARAIADHAAELRAVQPLAGTGACPSAASSSTTVPTRPAYVATDAAGAHYRVAATWREAAPQVVRAGDLVCLGVDGALQADWQEFRWSFGDGGTASGAVVTHRFAAAGSYTVRLTALNDGAARSAVAVQLAATDR